MKNRIMIIPIFSVCLVVPLFLTSCDLKNDESSIVGKWKGVNPEDGIMVFSENGSFNILNEDGKSFFDGELKKLTITWEAITEVEPHQVYITMTEGDNIKRIPLGIYKIEKRKLILREPITYHRSLGGIDMGISRYEIPKDFSGIVKVFKRI